MPKARPPTSGYARLAQAEEEDDSDCDNEDPYRSYSSLSTPGARYAAIQPSRQARMQGPEATTPTTKRRHSAHRRVRSNSGVDIKAINARLERWADEIASKFKIGKGKGRTHEEEQPEIQHSVFQAPDWVRPATAESLATDYPDAPGTRLTKADFEEIVESVKVAIELGTHPKLISQGSSGSYFARNAQGKVVGVFKPKDEEPYASRNPKWTKWIHRNLFPFFFGRACLIPNLSYISEAAAYVLDTQLRTNLVPYTDIVSLSSKSFFYDFWDRRAYYRKKKPLPDKIGSFQVFLKGFKDANILLKENPWPDQNSSYRADGAPRRKKRRWGADCRPGGAPSDDEADDEDIRPNTAEEAQRRRVFWTDALQISFREQLERLVILDYIMRNTDRGLDNWMIKIDEQTQKATIVVEPPKDNGDVNGKPANGHLESHNQQYPRQEPMSSDSRTATPSNGSEDSITIGAIDNSLSWPWKHPDAWRSYPFGWLFLPVSLIGQPFSDATRNHFLPLLTSKKWWSDTQLALRHCFIQDDDFQERMYAKQIAVMKGQAWNVVETLKTPDHGPLELTRRARVCVWDDLVDVPVAVPLRMPSAEMRRRQAAEHRDIIEEHEEMDISAAHSSDPPPQHDLLSLQSPSANENNRFNLSRQSSATNVQDTNQGESTAPLSPSGAQGISWAGQRPNRASAASPFDAKRPSAHKARMSYEEPQRPRESPESRRRRFSFSHRRGSNALMMGDDDEGDLGYSAAEDMEGNQKRVIVERLETVKAGKPFFTWC